MEQWIEVAKNFGLLGAIVLALGIFLYQKVWPFITKQLEDAQTTIRARDMLLGETLREHLKALEEITSELRALRDDVRAVRK